MAIALFEHNRIAYDAALSMLKETGKAAVVHPTGTGKSFIAFKFCEDNPDKQILWLSPSEYIFKTQLENLKTAGGEEPKNITFATYSKFSLYTDEEIQEIHTDCLILDEFHRAGAETWQINISKFLQLFPNVPVLGLSATAIRYLDNQRDMSEEIFGGNIASDMTLGEAIVRGILNPPKYVLSAFSYQKDLEKYERRVKVAKNKAVHDAAEKYLEALRRALEKADGLDAIFDKHMTDRTGKYIVFCANKEHMDEMMEKSGEWFAKVDKAPHIYSVYSDDPGATKSFADFKADNDDMHLRLLYCIDALNEGIHVENVSGVILLRPTVSPIIYKQQIGRALSASKKKDAVIFDIVMNIENLYSIDSVEEEMRAAMTYYRSFGDGEIIVNEQFKVIDELRDCRELFEKLNDTLTASWDVMYGYAEEYYRKHGDLEIPRRYKTPDGCSLGSWISTQRKVHSGERYGVLGADRIAKLDAIGMVWESMRDAAWERYYAEAKKYRESHGDLRIPALYVTKEGLPLGNWIVNLRISRKNGIRSKYLTEERIRAMDAIDMIWDVPDYLWERNYAAAMEYHREHGDLDVPGKYVSPTGVKLGMWLQKMRSDARCGRLTLSDEQMNMLFSLGFRLTSSSEAAWRRGFEEAQTYYVVHHHLDVRYLYRSETGYPLWEWIANQRERFKSGKMDPERIEKLNGIGMIWSKPDSWEQRFSMAEEYFRKHGNLQVPAKYKVGKVDLNKWLNDQKQMYYGKRKKKLTEEQIRRLESIGMDWRNFNQITWERNYNAAKAYLAKRKDGGSCQGRPGQPKAASDRWILAQRKYYREGRLTAEQIEKLNAIGMVWELPDTWEIGFAHAKAYFTDHGDLKISNKYVCDDGFPLGKWLLDQRKNHNHPTKYKILTAEQAKRLEDIGAVWNISDRNWNAAYALAADYYRLHGGLHVSNAFKTKSGFSLGSWIYDQREKQN